jgi:hypothetical protein
MQKIIYILIGGLGILFFSSCSKKDYAVRFKNDFNETINNIKVANAFIGTVKYGETSDYFYFNGKSFMVTGMSATGRAVNDTEAVSGNGKHRWTITLNSDGTISFDEDAI